MTKEDIIRMAADSNLQLYGLGRDWEKFVATLELFAAFVAAAEREAKNELLAALQDLLMDTQHSDHFCEDKNCPVAHAKAVALKYDAILGRKKA